MSRLMALLLLSLNFSVAPLFAGEIFKCRDAMGRVAFQDSPCHTADHEEKLSSPSASAGIEAPSSVVILPEKSRKSLAKETPAKKTVGSHNFAWRLTKGKQQGYLMGSIHFGKASMYPLPVVLLNAFKASDALVVEANVLDADTTTMAHMMMNSGMYSDGTTLKTILNADMWDELGVTSAALGIPVSILAGMRPWFASMTLTTIALKGIGLDESLGIDRHFMEMAKKTNKPIRELESVQKQLALLSGLSQKVQIAMLKQTLQDVKTAAAYFDTMLDAWQAGDVLALDQLVVGDVMESAEISELNRIMITDRNSAMADGIDEMLRGGCICFVVVGAGHPGGEQGIITLLQLKGYRVEQL
ncbi:MAG: TraB/GumN family protein [Gammaproteobacteria bacterium]|nr:TraB/GumN family protein [Gammaproteobacteria bacterium]